MLKTTVFTNNEKLIKEIESFNKCGIDCVHLNHMEDSEIIIIDSDNYMDIDDKYYYIQVLNPNYPHLNGVNSYIHTDDITNTIIDLLHAMYGVGLISMDEHDVMQVLRNKVFKYHRYELDNPIDELNSKSLISKLYLKNKNILMVIYSDMNCSISEIDYIFKEMKQKYYNERFVGYYIDETKGNKRIINFFIEE